jgi:hypothetical protein
MAVFLLRFALLKGMANDFKKTMVSLLRSILLCVGERAFRGSAFLNSITAIGITP